MTHLQSHGKLASLKKNYPKHGPPPPKKGQVTLISVQTTFSLILCLCKKDVETKGSGLAMQLSHKGLACMYRIYLDAPVCGGGEVVFQDIFLS